MKKAVVSYISFGENNLISICVEVEDEATWKDAAMVGHANGLGGKFNAETLDSTREWYDSMSDDMEEAKEEMFSGDLQLNVIFVR